MWLGENPVGNRNRNREREVTAGKDRHITNYKKTQK